MRRFHGAAQGTMVATQSLRDELTARGFSNIRAWSRGVDLELFKPEPREDWDLPRPIFLYAGRVAVEKNIEAFLDLDLPGTKVVVGGGPQLARLQRALSRTCVSPARATARNSPAPMPAPTSSSSPAAPTRSAW